MQHDKPILPVALDSIIVLSVLISILLNGQYVVTLLSKLWSLVFYTCSHIL